MRTAKDWKEFEVIDTSSGEKLERWGDVILARPDPQVIWNTPKGETGSGPTPITAAPPAAAGTGK